MKAKILTPVSNHNPKAVNQMMQKYIKEFDDLFIADGFISMDERCINYENEVCNIDEFLNLKTLLE
jgi:hypothetical protein